MFKDLLVHLPTSQSARPVINYSVSLAARTAAPLAAVAFGYEPLTVQIAFNGAAAVAPVMELQHERALEQANAVLADFEAEAKLMGIEYRARAYAAIPAEAAEIMQGLSRVYDLTIVSQPEPGHSVYDDLVPEAVAVNAGGPVLVVPYIQKGPFSGNRIAICWDGSRSAARAVHDALPLLERADAVDIVAVNEENSTPSSADLVAHLARHGVSANAVRLTANRSDIHNALVSAATDAGANLLVMGAYGHSRLREFVLGGVSRGMFRSMAIPVLMSH